MKNKIIALSFSLIGLMACEQKLEKKDNSAANIQLVKDMFASFNEHNWDQMASYYSDSAEFKDPSFGDTVVIQNRHQISEKYGELNAMFPDVKDEIVNIYPAGEKNIVVEFISTGTAPDSSKMKLPICTIFTIENGLITKDYTYYDNF